MGERKGTREREGRGEGGCGGKTEERSPECHKLHLNLLVTENNVSGLSWQMAVD